MPKNQKLTLALIKKLASAGVAITIQPQSLSGRGGYRVHLETLFEDSEDEPYIGTGNGRSPEAAFNKAMASLKREIAADDYDLDGYAEAFYEAWLA